MNAHLVLTAAQQMKYVSILRAIFDVNTMLPLKV